MTSEILLIATGVFLNFVVEKQSLRDSIKNTFVGLKNRLIKERDDRREEQAQTKPIKID